MRIRKLMEANEPLEDVSYSLEVEQDFDGPDVGVETGVSGLLLDQISKVAQNINDYNMMRANLEGYPEIDELIQSLADQENETLGKLQSALKSISPNAELIMNGAVEAESELDPGSPIDEALDEDYRTKDADELIEDAVKETLNFLIDNNIEYPYKRYSAMDWEEWLDEVNMGMTSLIEDAEVLKEFLEENIPEQSDLIKNLNIAISNYSSIYNSIDEALDNEKYKVRYKHFFRGDWDEGEYTNTGEGLPLYQAEVFKYKLSKNKDFKDISIVPLNEACGRKNIKNMKIIKEAHYGGAFDIEDDQFFTRDDLDEFGYYVEEELNNSDCSCPKEFQYAGCWIDNNVVTCAMTNGDYEHEIDFRVDMRRIKSPRDLIKRYAPGAIEEFKEAFESYYSYEM